MHLDYFFKLLGNKHKGTQERQNAIDAVHEIELPPLISVNAVNDLESRMQNEIAVIELDQPQLNWIWICRVGIGSAGFDLKTAVIGVEILYKIQTTLYTIIDSWIDKFIKIFSYGCVTCFKMKEKK